MVVKQYVSFLPILRVSLACRKLIDYTQYNLSGIKMNLKVGLAFAESPIELDDCTENT